MTERPRKMDFIKLEYAKAEHLLREWGVRSTIVVFGSAGDAVAPAARWLAAAAVDQDRELDALGAPVVEERVDRRAVGAG